MGLVFICVQGPLPTKMHIPLQSTNTRKPTTLYGSPGSIYSILGSDNVQNCKRIMVLDLLKKNKVNL
jgi:hypothetical protein